MSWRTWAWLLVLGGAVFLLMMAAGKGFG